MDIRLRKKNHSFTRMKKPQHFWYKRQGLIKIYNLRGLCIVHESHDRNTRMKTFREAV